MVARARHGLRGTPAARVSDERLGFDNVPEVYDRARPSYPDALFDDLLAYLDAPAPIRAVEIGAIGFGVLAAARWAWRRRQRGNGQQNLN